MQTTRVLSLASGLLYLLIGVIIGGNDLIVGYKSSVPIVSLIISLTFIGVGGLIWRLGKHVGMLSVWVMPEGMRTYKLINGYLNGAFIFIFLSGAFILYGVVGRVIQGYSIFG